MVLCLGIQTPDAVYYTPSDLGQEDSFGIAINPTAKCIVMSVATPPQKALKCGTQS